MSIGVRILIDLKGVGPIASASPLVCDWVDVVRMDLEVRCNKSTFCSANDKQSDEKERTLSI